MNKRPYRQNHLKFLIVAIVIMVLSDHFLFDSTRPYIEKTRQQVVIDEKAVDYKNEEKAEGPSTMMQMAIQQAPPPLWRRNAVELSLDPAKDKVIIVIDDLGVSRKYTKEILDLPAPLTLAFLPYAKKVSDLVEDGRSKGHEIMIHMPMEPENEKLDMGAVFLSTKQKDEEFSLMLDKAFESFDGYVGMNNHMGSRLTSDKEAMAKVMRALKQRELLFLDSRTIGSSVAALSAKSENIPYAIRDVFIDHDDSAEAIEKALLKVEQLAKKNGQAIAIGHPKENTIHALKEWLPLLDDKDLQLVPISAAVFIPIKGESDVVISETDLEPSLPHQ